MSAPSAVFETHTPEATERLGACLADMLPAGAVVALCGDLASGKTCLVRGMARHFAGAHDVHSPTFTLVNEYGHDPTLIHLDLYRLSGPEELADLGYEELFDSGVDVCVVEWAERAEPLLPASCLHIALSHGGGDTRRIEFQNETGLPADWQARLKEAIGE